MAAREGAYRPGMPATVGRAQRPEISCLAQFEVIADIIRDGGESVHNFWVPGFGPSGFGFRARVPHRGGVCQGVSSGCPHTFAKDAKVWHPAPAVRRRPSNQFNLASKMRNSCDSKGLCQRPCRYLSIIHRFSSRTGGKTGVFSRVQQASISPCVAFCSRLSGHRAEVCGGQTRVFDCQRTRQPTPALSGQEARNKRALHI